MGDAERDTRAQDQPQLDHERNFSPDANDRLCESLQRELQALRLRVQEGGLRKWHELHILSLVRRQRTSAARQSASDCLARIEASTRGNQHHRYAGANQRKTVILGAELSSAGTRDVLQKS